MVRPHLPTRPDPTRPDPTSNGPEIYVARTAKLLAMIRHFAGTAELRVQSPGGIQGDFLDCSGFHFRGAGEYEEKSVLLFGKLNSSLSLQNGLLYTGA